MWRISGIYLFYLNTSHKMDRFHTSLNIMLYTTWSDLRPIENKQHHSMILLDVCLGNHGQHGFKTLYFVIIIVIFILVTNIH